MLTARPSQALLEEIERHGEKVEECQKFAKQYINAIKVRLCGLESQGTCAWWARDLRGPQPRPCWGEPGGRSRARWTGQSWRPTGLSL